jgi:hypothetical protein
MRVNISVTGEAGGVPNIMCGVMQGFRLNMTHNHNDRETKQCGKSHWKQTNVDCRSGGSLCRHIVLLAVTPDGWFE